MSRPRRGSCVLLEDESRWPMSKSVAPAMTIVFSIVNVTPSVVERMSSL